MLLCYHEILSNGGIFHTHTDSVRTWRCLFHCVHYLRGPGGSLLLRWRVALMKRRGGSRVHHDAAIERFYTTRAWRNCRASFLKEKDGLCEICMSKGLIVPAEHVHHRTPITPDTVNNPEVTLNHGNLMALCEACHAEQHRKKRWRCDPMGHVLL